jgi:1-acyl-sn-glycerol-3-phosphate acyltransferase
LHTSDAAFTALPPGPDDTLWERRLVPFAEMLLRARYFTFDVEGAEHVPRDGQAVFAQNHAGWFPLDAFFVGLAIRRACGPGRTPLFATAEAALALPVVGPFIRRVGAVPASWFRRPERLPSWLRSCGIFPEGVPGNTKPFWEAYRMRPWSRGFVRVAAALDVPIVPVAVLGGEECVPVAWTVRLLEPLFGAPFGLPLSLLPLPARWRVVFHPPVWIPDARAALRDHALSARIAEDVRRTVATTLAARARSRPLAQVAAWVSGERPTARPVPVRTAARARAGPDLAAAAR